MARRKGVRTIIRGIIQRSTAIGPEDCPTVDGLVVLGVVGTVKPSPARAFSDIDAMREWVTRKYQTRVREYLAPVAPAPPIKLAAGLRAVLRSPAFESKIIQLAEQGNTKDIIELAQARLAHAKRKMTDAEKFRKTPVHAATLIAEEIKLALEILYPEPSIEVINQRACELTAGMWNLLAPRGKTVQASTLRGQLRRSKKGKRRIALKSPTTD